MIFLDGSLGHELLERAKKKFKGTWSAQFLLKESHLISEVYEAVSYTHLRAHET